MLGIGKLGHFFADFSPFLSFFCRFFPFFVDFLSIFPLFCWFFPFFCRFFPFFPFFLPILALFLPIFVLFLPIFSLFCWFFPFFWVETKKRENSAKKEENSAKKEKNSAKKGENSAKKGEKSANKRGKRTKFPNLYTKENKKLNCKKIKKKKHYHYTIRITEKETFFWWILSGLILSVALPNLHQLFLEMLTGGSRTPLAKANTNFLSQLSFPNQDQLPPPHAKPRTRLASPAVFLL